MAKQTGIIALRGKIKGQSYYGSKVGGDLVRTINEGMSARVKSSQEYANTRKNNAEFGMCGDFAGAIIKPITQRWRFILDSIATGKMVKAMKELAVLDTAGEWGKRVVKLANYGTIYEKFNSFSKNEMPTEIVNALAKGVTLNNEGTAILLESTGVQTAEFVSQMQAIGADKYTAAVYALYVEKPVYDAVAGVYTKASSNLVYSETISAAAEDVNLNSDIFAGDSFPVTLSPVNTESKFAGLLTIFMPMRTIGNKSSILQQHCSAYLVPVSAAE